MVVGKIEAITYAAVILGFLSILAIVLRSRLNDTSKKVIFISMAAVIVSVTAYLVVATVYSNVISVTNGPVHWHASIAFKICGQEYQLDNRDIAVDKPAHTHADQLVHIETTPIRWEDVQLNRFFEYIGGEFTKTSLSFPSDSGIVSAKNGELCDDKPATLKMFVNGKLESKMDEYVISPVEAGEIDKILLVFD